MCSPIMRVFFEGYALKLRFPLIRAIPEGSDMVDGGNQR